MILEGHRRLKEDLKNGKIPNMPELNIVPEESSDRDEGEAPTKINNQFAP